MYVAVTRAEKRFYMTDSEGFNFTTGLNKYPSRFLFEIKEEFYVRKGKLSPEILQASQSSSAAAKNSEDMAFKQGDYVMHPVWNRGRIEAVDLEKNQYIVHFFEMEKEKPIDFAFRFLTAASDSQEDSASPADLLDLHENLKNMPDPFKDNDAANGVFEKDGNSSDIFDAGAERSEKKWPE